MKMGSVDKDDSKKITVAEVAQKAGVSPASVSRVLNNIQPISTTLRHAVEQAIDELGYKRKRQSHSYSGPIGLVLPDFQYPYFQEIAAGVQMAAKDYGMMVSEFITDPNPSANEELLKWFSKGNVEAIVYMSSTQAFSDKQLKFLAHDCGLPVVLINRRYPGDILPSIQIDYLDATIRATQHLIKLNHRKIALMGGPLNSESGAMKKKGFEIALAESNIKIPDEYIVHGAPTIEFGYQSINQMLDFPREAVPTAVLCLSDLNALGVLHAVRTRRMSVPDDLSVVGFDDIVIAAHANPPLTTIRSPKIEMGIRAVQIIQEMKSGQNLHSKRTILMESPLIVRESTAFCTR